ncbi:hypothetical protein [Streptomyces sp. 8N616]|uniref:hypothetical protein n=1 Tax=Streptomyces sp. 8N616 TaxID=3457414 RepID=UPI003FD40F01
MEASVWISAVSGLAGTAVGGGLSIWASIAAQQHQARSARALMVAQKVDAAADAAIRMFFQIKQHIRGRPSVVGPNPRARMEAWDKSLQQQTGKLEPTLLRIRDQEVRLRLTEITYYLATREMSEPDFRGSFGLLEMLCDHALECLGAFIRDEQLPPEDSWMSHARQVEAMYDAYMEEQAREYEEGHH